MKGYKSLETTRDFVKDQAKHLRKALKVFRKTCSKQTFQTCISPTFLKLSSMDDLTWESYIACENQISRTMGNHLGANYMYSTMMLHSVDLNSECLSNFDGQQVWKGSAPFLRNALHTAIWDREEIGINDPSKYMKADGEEAVSMKARFGNGMDESAKENLLKIIEIAESQCSLSKMINGIEPASSTLTGESRVYIPLQYESSEKTQEILRCIEGNFDRRSLDQYFYTTDRVVIYPESVELLTSIFEADYHLDGFELDTSLKDFILMMPEGFEINGIEVPSIQVSISSRYQRNISLYSYVRDALEKRCRDFGASELYHSVIEQYKIKQVSAKNVFEIANKYIGIHGTSLDKWTQESIAKFEDEIEETGQSFDEALEAINLRENFETEIVLKGGGAYANLGLGAFFNAVNADKDPESEKQFLENNYSNDGHQNQESADRLADICKLICSVLVYCQALGDEVLHKGVPFKKDNVIKLSKNANKKKGTTSMTLRGPKGFSSKRAQSHYRKWHFRTLKDERFYQSDEWKDKPRGSRVVFVRDSVVNRDVSPHVLTDGTNVEDKVMTAEMSKEANNG
jgi:hypothetical protein